MISVKICSCRLDKLKLQSQGSHKNGLLNDHQNRCIKNGVQINKWSGIHFVLQGVALGYNIFEMHSVTK